MYSVPCNLFYEVQIHTILHHHAFPTRKKNERKKVLPTLLKVDNLNAKCKPFNAVAPASICRLGVYNIIQKKFKRIKEGSEDSQESYYTELSNL